MSKILRSGILVALCVAPLQLAAQFQRDDRGLVEGLITVNLTRTTTVTRDGFPISRTTLTHSFSSKVIVQVGFASLEEYKQGNRRIVANGEMLGAVVAGDNFVRTLQQGETLGVTQVPRQSVPFAIDSKTYEPDPCDRTSEHPPLIRTGGLSGGAAFTKAAVNVVLYREGDPSEGLRLCVRTGDLPWQLGGDKINALVPSGLQQEPGENGETKCVMKDGEGCGMQGPLESPLLLYGYGSTGDKRLGRRMFVRSDNTSKEEFQILGIDTGAFYSYLQKHPATQSFPMSGSYRKTLTINDEITDIAENCSVVLTLGFDKRKLVLSAPDEQAYHEWLPIPEGEKDWKPIRVKATLDLGGNVREDSLAFFLDEVTHYPGTCSNYPEYTKAESSADLEFAPQSEQPAYINVIDSVHATTRTKVKEAEIKVRCKDYAAFGKLRVYAIGQGLKGKSKYNDQEYFPIPEDNDFNKIADAWEDDPAVHMHQRDASWDQEGEQGKTQIGDGMSFLEEYRGFMVEEGGKKVFKRLDPNKREVFVVDKEPTKALRREDWERASGLTMIYLATDQIKRPFDFDGATKDKTWRQADFNGDRQKNAVYIVQYPTEDDPYALRRIKNEYDQATEWGGHICFYDGNVGMLNYFAKRIERAVREYPEFTINAMKPVPDPLWIQEDFDAVAKAHSLTHDQLVAAATQSLPLWAGADLSDLTDQIKRFVIVHEMGHACRLPGHLRAVTLTYGDDFEATRENTEGKPLGAESTLNDDTCPMSYIKFDRKIELVIFTIPNGTPIPAMFGKTKFCNDPTDKCFYMLSAKN